MMEDLPISRSMLRLNNPGISRAISITLTSRMLFPKEKNDISRQHYQSLNVLHSVSFLTNECGFSKEEAGSQLINLAEGVLGSWDRFVLSLVSKKMSEQGHGSVSALAEKALIAGLLFYVVFVERCSLHEAASMIYSGAESSGLLGQRSFQVDNIVNNIWAQWKPVAHLWAALSHFEMPNPTDSYIALDKVVLKNKDLPVEEGLEGLIELAEYYYVTSVEEGIGFKQSSQKLVDPKSAWNVFLIS